MPVVLRAFVFLAATLLSGLTASHAQDRVWLQIEAQPRLDTAQERAEAYAGVFPETNGFRLRSGWYAIVLGPYAVAEGAAMASGCAAKINLPRALRTSA